MHVRCEAILAHDLLLFLQEASKLADSIAASEEHVEELKGRISARQDWIAQEQDSVDRKIEEATRPVAAQRTEAAQQHATLEAEVEELRCVLCISVPWLGLHVALTAAEDPGRNLDLQALLLLFTACHQ